MGFSVLVNYGYLFEFEILFWLQLRNLVAQLWPR